MSITSEPSFGISDDLVEAVRSFPARREVEHCGMRFEASPFDFYATCPRCGARIKLRSFSATPELEDVFDAVFEWMNQPGSEEIVARRRAKLSEEE